MIERLSRDHFDFLTKLCAIKARVSTPLTRKRVAATRYKNIKYILILDVEYIYIYIERKRQRKEKKWKKN